MASRRKPPLKLKFSLILTLWFLASATPSSKSVEVMGSDMRKEMKLVLGSRPPRCTNRCLSCRPCMAVLVIPPHKKNNVQRQEEEVSSSSVVMPQEEENYYLLSWKCRCKNRFFQP